MTPLHFITGTLAWTVGHLAVLALLDRGTKRPRPQVVELWSAWFYATICLWTAAVVLSAEGCLFAPLQGRADGVVISTVAYFVAHMIATQVYLGRDLPPSFVLHHLVFASLLAVGDIYYSQKAPAIIAVAFLQQSTGVTFHLMNAFRMTSELSPRASAVLAVVDYAFYGLVRVIGIPALGLVYGLHTFAGGPADVFITLVFPLGFVAGTAFNLYWFPMKTRKLFPSLGASRFFPLSLAGRPARSL